MRDPIVTIGIPVHNEARFLNQTILSARSQTLKQIEIIVSDNASTDESWKIMKRHANEDGRVRLLKHSTKIPALDNFRIVLDQARTPYFVWLGGHDLFKEDYIEKAVACLEKEDGVVMVYPGRATFVDRNGKFVMSGACSDIDTGNMRLPIKRVLHIVDKLCWNTEIHGVFRTAVLKRLPFKKVIAADCLIVCTAGLYGNIRSMDITGIEMRKVHNEDYVGTISRWKSEGIFQDDNLILALQKSIKEHCIFVRQHISFLHLYEFVLFLVLKKALYKKYLESVVDDVAYVTIRRALHSNDRFRGFKMLWALVLCHPSLVSKRYIWGAARRIILRRVG